MGGISSWIEGKEKRGRLTEVQSPSSERDLDSEDELVPLACEEKKKKSATCYREKR